MALDDENFIELNDKTRLLFDSNEAKQGFLNNISDMCKKSKIIQEEGYKCGHCAAHPCYRHREDEDNAGLCFQPLRRCRQECSNYNYIRFPADGAICKKFSKLVSYEQLCIAEQEKLDKLKKAGK